MAVQRYWNANYWQANYWDDEFWAAQSGGEITGQISASVELGGPGTSTGQYWGANYWNSNYWNTDYWKEADSAGGGTTFFGTFVAVSNTIGSIATTLGDNPAVFAGSVGQVELFDLDVGFSVNWSFSETSTFTGSIGVTLEDAPTTILGQFSADFIGSIGTTLGDDAANFDGTHIAPANRSGLISTELGDGIAELVGLFAPASGNVGALNPSLDDVAANLDGQYIPTNTDGSIGVTLDDVVGNLDGVFIDAGAKIGTIAVSLDGFSTSFVGAVVDPTLKIVKTGNRGNTRRRRNKSNTRRKAG